MIKIKITGLEMIFQSQDSIVPARPNVKPKKAPSKARKPEKKNMIMNMPKKSLNKNLMFSPPQKELPAAARGFPDAFIISSRRAIDI